MFWITWHPKITIDEITCFRALHIPRKDIIDNPDIKWIFHDMLDRDDFTFEDLLPFAKTDEDWRGLSRSPKVTMEIIHNNKSLPWSWMDISSNINITWIYIAHYQLKDLNWYCLSANPAMTIEIIKTYTFFLGNAK